MKDKGTILGLLVIAIIVAVGALAYDGSLGQSSKNEPVTLSSIPAPSGYLGANFVSHIGIYPLSTSSSADPSIGPGSNIPQYSGKGYFTFAFSNSSYSFNDLSLFYSVCTSIYTRNSQSAETNQTSTSFSATGISSGSLYTESSNQSCSPSSSLQFSFGESSQNQYEANTTDISLPCGNLVLFSGKMIPTQYMLVRFGVKTLSQPNATPYFFLYIVYSSCTSTSTTKPSNVVQASRNFTVG